MDTIANAFEPLTFAMTQNTWTKALEARNNRYSLNLENEHASNDLRYQFPLGDNPFAYDFITNTDVSITPILTAPNTWSTATRGAVTVRFNADAHAGIRHLVSFGDTNADTYISLWIAEDEKITASCVIAGTAQWTFKSDNAIIADGNVWYTVKLWMREPAQTKTLAPKLFINGDGVPITFSVTTDKTVWMSGVTAIDNAYIGVLSSSSSLSDYFEGEIDYVKIEEFAAPTSPTGNTQVALYRLDEGTSTTAGDSFTHGDHGTITAGGGGWVARTDGTLAAASTTRFLSPAMGDTYIDRALWVFTAAASGDVELTESVEKRIRS